MPAWTSSAPILFGLLHDIGRRAGVTGIRHIFDGYDYMTALGQPEDARHPPDPLLPACRTSAPLDGRTDCTGEQLAFLRDFLSRNPYDDYDRLIQLCDAISLPGGACIVEKRLVETSRRGTG